NFFRGDPRLEAAAVSDPAHIVQGATGLHVRKIQAALIFLDQLTIDLGEIARSTYGPSTAAAVLAYKKKRNIINRSYQTQADNIVGKMTMTSLDNEMVGKDLSLSTGCCDYGPRGAPSGDHRFALFGGQSEANKTQAVRDTPIGTPFERAVREV